MLGLTVVSWLAMVAGPTPKGLPGKVVTGELLIGWVLSLYEGGAQTAGGPTRTYPGVPARAPTAHHREGSSTLGLDSTNDQPSLPGGKLAGSAEKLTPQPAAAGSRGAAGAAAREEAERLWAAFRAKPSDDTRNELVVHYQPLIRQIIRRFATRLPRSVDRGDLSTAANVGLIRAIHGFDHERGVRFESYCELRVKGGLLDELRSQDWLPRPWRFKIEQQKRTLERLRREMGREPGDSEIASAMGLGLDVYQQTFGVGLPGTPSGSMPADESSDDGSAMGALNLVPDRQAEVPGEKLSRDELLKLVGHRMSDQEKRIIYLKYWEELPMREIGEMTGLSESRVCKIHTRLIERMQDRFRVGQPDVAAH